MFEKRIHIAKATLSQLVLAASLFCVLFGEGTHLHDIAVHIGEHFDVHAHVHAHESNKDPFQEDTNQDNHRHDVSTASDIIGTLTSPIKVRPELQKKVFFLLNTGCTSVSRTLDESPTLFGLPPPGPATNPNHLSSISHRGPPIA